MEEKIISKPINKWDYQNDNRIFFQDSYFYDFAEKAIAIQNNENIISIDIELVSGFETYLNLYVNDRNNLYFEFGSKIGAFEMPSNEYIDSSKDEKVKLIIKETETDFLITHEQIRVNVTKEPFQITVYDVEKLKFQTSIKKVSRQFITPGLGHRVKNDGTREAFLSWNINNGDSFYGLGEKFGNVEKSQSRITSYAMDACGTNTTDLAYKCYPMILSTSGYGMMLLTARRTCWDIGEFCYVSGTVLSESPILRGYLFFGENLKELVKNQSEIQGRPEVVSPWTLGVWYSYCSYETREEVFEVKNKLKELDIPFDVLNIDVRWGKNYWYRKFWVDCCDFEWGDEKFPNPVEMFKELWDDGIACSVWMNPYLPPGTKIYEEGKAKGYLVKTIHGGLATIQRRQVSDVGIPDLTNPEAYEWWKGYVKNLMKLGIKAIKPDYTDRIPEDALFANAYTGIDMHNMYIYLYIKACYEATQEVHGTSLVWKRPGFTGTGKYAGTWSGDVESTFEGLKMTLRGGLSVGFTGECFWSSDIGGFKGEKPSEELYIRWSQVGLLCSLARYHGTSRREPWEYGEKAINVVREYSKLRYRLMPYLMEKAVEASETGIPVMRHLALEYPNDRIARKIDDQFLLGDSVIIVPILEEGQISRDVYLPVGRWYDIHNKKIYDGNQLITVPVSLEDIPIFVKEGAVIALFTESQAHLKTFNENPIEVVLIGDVKAYQGVLLTEKREKIPFSIVDNNLDINTDLLKVKMKKIEL